jgi:hypothetical protein
MPLFSYLKKKTEKISISKLKQDGQGEEMQSRCFSLTPWPMKMGRYDE